MHWPDLHVQLSKRSKLSSARINLYLPSVPLTRRRQICWLLRIFRPGDTLKSPLLLRFLSIKSRHHAMTNHVEEEFLFIVCIREELLAFRLSRFVMYLHSDSVSIPQDEGTSSVPYPWSYGTVPEYIDVSTLKKQDPDRCWDHNECG